MTSGRPACGVARAAHYVRFTSEAERAEMNDAIAAELGVAPVDLGGGAT